MTISKELLDRHTEECRQRVEAGLETPETLDFFVSLQRDLGSLSEEDWEIYSRLIDNMPKADQDKLLITVKGNLLIEEMTLKFIESRLPNPDALRRANFSTAQRISIAESMCLDNDEPRWLWAMVRELNSIRNKMAHNLDIQEVETRLDRFVSEVASQQDLSNPSISAAIARLYGMVKGLLDLSFSDGFRNH